VELPPGRNAQPVHVYLLPILGFNLRHLVCDPLPTLSFFRVHHLIGYYLGDSLDYKHRLVFSPRSERLLAESFEEQESKRA